MADLDGELRQALGFLQQGQLAEAQRALAAIVQRHPDNFPGLQLLGVVLLERSQPELALQYFDRAARIDASSAAVYYNRGNALSALGRSAEAVASYDESLARKADVTEAWFNRGNCLRGLGRFDEALASFQRSVELQPGLVQGHNSVGLVLHALGRLDDALASLDRALSLDPRHAGALNNRGMVLHDLGRLDEALSNFDRAIALHPGLAQAYNHRGLVLVDLGRMAEAMQSYDQALVLHPGLVDAWSNRGSALNRLKQFDAAIASCQRALGLQPAHAGALNVRGVALHEQRLVAQALDCYDQAIAVQPGSVEAWNNRGNALHDLRRMDEAMRSYEHALQLRPDFVEAINNRGMVRQDLRQLDAARADFDRAIALRPGYPEAYRRRASLRLLQGDFAGGFADYEQGVQLPVPGSIQHLDIAYWRGEDLAGKSILLSEPNGLGDTLQFIRFVPALLERGARVAFLAPPNLHRVLHAFADRVELISEAAGLRFDFQCWTWSLPHLLRIDPGSLAQTIPYLAAEPALIRRWADRLDPARFNVGICWQGNPQRKIDAGRSIPLAAFAPLAPIPGVRLISLQKNFGLDQLERLPPGMKVQTLAGFDEGPDAFVDSAALLESLDLVIAADTSITHLAGALGRPAWLALNAVPDWRWQLDRDDSPWYPSVRLFRQQPGGDWSPVLAEIASALQPLAAAKASAGDR